MSVDEFCTTPTPQGHRAELAAESTRLTAEGAGVVHRPHGLDDLAISVYDERAVALLQEQHAREQAEMAIIKAVLGSVYSVRKPRDAFAGTASGLKTVARGVGLGLASLFAQPYLGAKYGGAKGFMKGVGAGLATCTASTVVGTVVGTGQIVRGVVNTPSAVINKARGQVWNSEHRAWEKDWYSLPEEAAEVLASSGDGDAASTGQAPGASGSSASSAASSSRRPRRIVDTALYEVLEVSTEASDTEVRKAFYKKSLALHPDKNPDNPEATRQFQAVSDAYRVLGDPVRRRTYDEVGQDRASAGLAKVEPAVFFAVLFGSHHFERYVGRLRLAVEVDDDILSLFNEAVKETDEEKPSLDVLKVYRAHQKLKVIERQRHVRCAVQLAQLLQPVVGLPTDSTAAAQAFATWEKEQLAEATKLAQVPFGVEMLYLVGWVYSNMSKRFSGMSVLHRSAARMEGHAHMSCSKAHLANALGRTVLTANSTMKAAEKKNKLEEQKKAVAKAEAERGSASDAAAPGAQATEAKASPAPFAAESVAPAESTTTHAAESDVQRELAVGTVVMLHGLTGMCELNDEVGMVCGIDAESGRYVVHVLPDIGPRKLRRDNLLVLEEVFEPAGAFSQTGRGFEAPHGQAVPPAVDAAGPTGPAAQAAGAEGSGGPAGAEEGKWAQAGEDADMAEAFKDMMPLIHDSLWKATALDIEHTLTQVVQKVLRDMSVTKTARQQRAEALFKLGQLMQEPMKERRRNLKRPVATEQATLPAAPAPYANGSGGARRSMLARFKPRASWWTSSCDSGQKAKVQAEKLRSMEAAIAMMAAGASTEDVDDMLAARAMMEAENFRVPF